MSFFPYPYTETGGGRNNAYWGVSLTAKTAANAIAQSVTEGTVFTPYTGQTPDVSWNPLLIPFCTEFNGTGDIFEGKNVFFWVALPTTNPQFPVFSKYKDPLQLLPVLFLSAEGRTYWEIPVNITYLTVTYRIYMSRVSSPMGLTDYLFSTA